MRNGNRRNQIAAILFALLLVVLFLSFSGIEATAAGHDCSGEACPVCQALNGARAVVRTLTVFGAAALLSEILLKVLRKLGQKPSGAVSGATLVSLKVKLSN